MENQRDDPYYKGYIAGYLDGVRDGVSGNNATKVESKLLALPIEAMQLSTRAIMACCGQNANTLPT